MPEFDPGGCRPIRKILGNTSRSKRFALIALLFSLLACGLPNVTNPPNTSPPLTSTIAVPVLSPTTVVLPTDLPSPTSAFVPDTGWELIRNGLERRIINLTSSEGNFRENLYLLRIDPALFKFDVAYHPGNPQSLTDWQLETGALVVVNGGFFTETNEATGLIIVDSQPSGVSYMGFGGMLAINESGPELRWLAQQPYDPAENLLAALQSFPMLVIAGNQIGYTEENGLPARRTVIAQDTQNQMIFLLATTGTFTLYELGQFLIDSDLNLTAALNLDGGASTGLLLAEPVGGVAPYSLLPVVITVYAK